MRVENNRCRIWEYFRTNIIAIRKSKGFTQKQIATNMGKSRNYYTELENGRSCPTLALVEEVAKALKVKPTMLIARPKQSRVVAKKETEKKS